MNWPLSFRSSRAATLSFAAAAAKLSSPHWLSLWHYLVPRLPQWAVLPPWLTPIPLQWASPLNVHALLGRHFLVVSNNEGARTFLHFLMNFFDMLRAWRTLSQHRGFEQAPQDVEDRKASHLQQQDCKAPQQCEVKQGVSAGHSCLRFHKTLQVLECPHIFSISHWPLWCLD